MSLSGDCRGAPGACCHHRRSGRSDLAGLARIDDARLMGCRLRVWPTEGASCHHTMRPPLRSATACRGSPSRCRLQGTSAAVVIDARATEPVCGRPATFRQPADRCGSRGTYTLSACCCCSWGRSPSGPQFFDRLRRRNLSRFAAAHEQNPIFSRFT